jgi:DNA-binding MarR family transcriptional regulator
MLSANKSKPTLSEEERAAFKALYLALKPFRDLNPSMPLSYITAMLLVGMEEGKGVTEYAAKVNISPTVMTRNLLDIGDRNRQREAGLGLITAERDLFDLRKHNAKVTPKGKALAHHVAMVLSPKGKEVVQHITKALKED